MIGHPLAAVFLGALPLGALLTIAVLAWPRAPHSRATVRAARPIELGF